MCQFPACPYLPSPAEMMEANPRVWCPAIRAGRKRRDHLAAEEGAIISKSIVVLSCVLTQSGSAETPARYAGEAYAPQPYTAKNTTSTVA
jgi:hypothetical protein